MELRNLFTIIFAIGLLSPFSAGAAVLRSIDADTIRSADHTKTHTLPGATGTILNTVSTNVPVAASLVQEVPSGTVNGSNVTFTLANTPGGATSVFLTLDGLALIQGGGNDYTISGATITMATAPATAQKLYVIYSKF